MSTYSNDFADVSTGDRHLSSGELKLDVFRQDRAAASFEALDTLQEGGTAQLSGTFDAVRCDTGLGG